MRRLKWFAVGGAALIAVLAAAGFVTLLIKAGTSGNIHRPARHPAFFA